MDIEEIIQTVVDTGNVEYMHALSDILEDVMEELEKYDRDCYKKQEMKLYRMAYGPHLTRELAEEIVNKMQPYGMHWTIQQTSQLQEQYGITNIKNTDFFVVMNSAYNDYHDIFEEDIEKYIKFTLDFIEDEDAKEGKVFTYFTQIPR